MERILIPIDGFGQSPAILTYGATLAEKIGAAVTVLHVIEPFSKEPTILAQFNAEQLEQTNRLLKKVAEEHIDAAKEALANAKVKIDYLVEVGDPADKILAVAKECGATLIAIGSRGMSPLGKLFLGSVSSKISMYADIPVLIVKK